MKKVRAVLLAILAAVIFSGCSAKFVLVANSGCLKTGDVELSRADTKETMTPDVTLPLIPLP